MLTSARLYIAANASIVAQHEGVLGVSIDWDQAAAIRDRMVARFPTKRKLALVDTMSTAGIIRLLGVDTPFKSAPDAMPYMNAVSLGTEQDGQSVTRISDILTYKERLAAGAIMEFTITEWEDIERHAGAIVAIGVLEAAGVLKPAQTAEQYEELDHDILLARDAAQRQFPDVMQLTFAAGVA